MTSTDPVVRFCPRCGAKAKANVELFSNPQTCPTCKSSVLFWDVTKEPIGDLLEAANIKPLLHQKLLVGLLAAAITASLAVIVMFVLGLVGVPVTLAAFFLAVGGYCIAIFLAQQHNIGILSSQLSQLLCSIEGTREQQSSLATKYSSLKDNFQSLVESATKDASDAKSNYEVYSAKLQAEYTTRVETIEQNASDKIAIAIQRENNAVSIVRSIATKYLSETQKQLIAKLNPDNLTQTQDKFIKAVEFCRKVGFEMPPSEVQAFQDEIKKEYAIAVRKQLARDEQSRIKEKLREEAKADAEFNREMKRLEQEEKLLERLLAEARSKATAESSAQIEELERRLAEAKEKERALSMAQQTKAGNVYVISNIGSFGENVFKIGMTRRLDPLDRVKELGDASVPFPFDVHMMVACENAPNMENELHKRFNNHRLNKVNFRKEFFAVSIEDIRRAVEDLHGEVEYVAEPEALQYRESLTMTDEQFALVTEISAQEGLDDEDDDRD
jgi:T5orf172 domain